MIHLTLRSALRTQPTKRLFVPATIRFMSNQQYANILTSRPDPGVALITLNRPKALNALNSALMLELTKALGEFDQDPQIGAIVITGSEKAFAAGADIKEMKDKKFADVIKENFLQNWSDMMKIQKPIIAAVSGFALGGGCELAMMCDIILASPTAKFGQPEINLGIIPAGGATQRLTHAIGKSRAMEIILTGRHFSAEEAEKWGLISRIVGEGEGVVVNEAVEMGKTIASKGQIAVQVGKECVNAGYELSLTEGLRLERRLFHGLFATQDQKEGMAAFAEKRKAVFTHL